MISNLSSLDEYRDFINGFADDPAFSDPHLACDPQNLWGAFGRKDHWVWGVFREGRMAGLFVFLIIENERYAEMIVGLSKDQAACAEMLAFITERCCGFSVDFVLNPSHDLLRSALQAHGAAFEAVQQTMVWKNDVPVERRHQIRPYASEYREAYLAMHSKDVYWTGEKVLSAPELFRVLLAVEAGEVVGYLDITHCHDVNEPYDWKVKDKGQGYERDLLAAAIALNRPKGLMAVVDAEDAEGIAILQSVGFERAEHRDSITAQIRC